MIGCDIKVSSEMLSSQHLLPRLPVPPLAETLQRFLRSVKPLLDETSYRRAEKLVQDFGRKDGEGYKLQALLEERAKNTDNWLDAWWLRQAYMDVRLPLPIYTSPTFALPDQFSNQESQLRYAALFIAGALEYKKLVDSETLDVHMQGDQPLCMSQVLTMFSSSRRPARGTDTFVHHPPNRHDSPRHILVARNNHFFSANVYSSTGGPLGAGAIYKQLREIVNQSASRVEPVGALTCQSRDLWADIYNEMKADATNKRSLESIESSILMVCLDQPIPMGQYDCRAEAIHNNALHGGGMALNGGNRWYEKNIQFTISEDGAVGYMMEHSSIDGATVAPFFDFLIKYVKSNHIEDTIVENYSLPNRLDFNLTPKLKTDIQRAKGEMEKIIADLTLKILNFDDFGIKYLKSLKQSPDGIFQVALQLAYYRLHHRVDATYESSSTRRFLRGRTETIRSCTQEARDFVVTADDVDVAQAEKVLLLKNAIGVHRRLAIEASQGQGVDRHLLGLKMIAQEHGLPMPDLLSDPIYTDTASWRLSTSRLVMAEPGVLASFGPVVSDGYGIFYNIEGDSIHAGITSWNSCAHTDAARLRDGLRRALSDVTRLLAADLQASL